jgi:RHS repeat-associated protein
MSEPRNRTKYTYDGNGLRVEKTNGTTGTLYWRDLAGNTIAETDLTGSTTDSAYREYIFFAGQRVAQRDATTPTPNVYFYYTDQVGSTTAISTAAGVSCYQATFTPYGQEMATQTTCSTNYKFTGYERDAETGFDYAFARYYNSSLGRFMSPDPLAGSIADPQSLNRYAYVGNSTTNFADPRGTHKCNAPPGQSIPAPCDGGGYGPGSDDGWGVDSAPVGFIYWGSLSSYGVWDSYSSVDYLAFWGYGGISYDTVDDFKRKYYHYYQKTLNDCISSIFGADSKNIPEQTLNNAPALNIGYSSAQIGAMQKPPTSDAYGENEPFVGDFGTILVAGNAYYHYEATSPNTIALIYTHELGNILDENLNGDAPDSPNFGKNYGDPHDPSRDFDTGQQLEECFNEALATLAK